MPFATSALPPDAVLAGALIRSNCEGPQVPLRRTDSKRRMSPSRELQKARSPRRTRTRPSARVQMAEYRAQGRWSLGVALAVVASAALSFLHPGAGRAWMEELLPIGPRDADAAGQVSHLHVTEDTRMAALSRLPAGTCRTAGRGVEAGACPSFKTSEKSPLETAPLSVEPLPLGQR